MPIGWIPLTKATLVAPAWRCFQLCRRCRSSAEPVVMSSCHLASRSRARAILVFPTQGETGVYAVFDEDGQLENAAEVTRDGRVDLDHMQGGQGTYAANLTIIHRLLNARLRQI